MLAGAGTEDITAAVGDEQGEAPRGGRSSGGRARARGGRAAVGRGRGRAAFQARNAALLIHTSEQRSALARTASLAQEAALEHVPTAMELAADPDDLAIIREIYGSRAQTIINSLLAFDAYFQWYYPLKESIPWMCEMRMREERAFDNMCRAVDKFEMYERVSIRSHKSFLPHGAVFKVTADILEVGDIWAIDLSPLEMQNGGTKGVADKVGARRIEFTAKDTAERQRQGPSKTFGPANLTTKSSYSTTTAKSVLRTLLGRQQLRRGDGIVTMPASRRNERLFGVTGTGRATLASIGIKLENMGKDYNPREDTCVKAFVRQMAARGEAAAATATC